MSPRFGRSPDAVVAAGAAERPGLQPAIAALNEFLDSLDAVWALPRAATPAKRAADETALIRRARDAFGRAQAEVRVLRQALGG